MGGRERASRGRVGSCRCVHFGMLLDWFGVRFIMWCSEIGECQNFGSPTSRAYFGSPTSLAAPPHHYPPFFLVPAPISNHARSNSAVLRGTGHSFDTAICWRAQPLKALVVMNNAPWCAHAGRPVRQRRLTRPPCRWPSGCVIGDRPHLPRLTVEGEAWQRRRRR